MINYENQEDDLDLELDLDLYEEARSRVEKFNEVRKLQEESLKRRLNGEFDIIIEDSVRNKLEEANDGELSKEK